jgi:thiol:disulfide interchange protein DsbD
VDAAHPGVLQEATAQNSPPINAIKPESTANTDTPRDEGTLAQQALQIRQLGRIGMMFLGFGLLLSLTPCVLPMVPILSSIIVGEGNVTRRRGFFLALSYSLGMALVYTGMGVAAGMAGEGLAGALQKPWVLITFAALLIGLALSMFDVYQLQLPSALQSRLSMTSDRLKGGRLTSVFIMGAISALIVGPCVAAPLAGALVYISQTHDVLIGGFALFSMALGMSVPLLLTGISAGSLLPRAGAWMNEVKHGFGLMLIGVAVWMLTPVLPGWALLFAWGAFAVLCAVFLRVFDPIAERASAVSRFVKALGLVFLIVGVLEFVGAASGGRNAMQPLGHMHISSSAQSQPQPEVKFSRIRNLAELEKTLKTANAPVLLDFYADWCVACKEMEHLTFSNAKVAEQLGQLVLLQADVTANSDEDRALMKQFSLFGPPGIILFNPAGQEIRHGRVVGYLQADAFLTHLKQSLAGFRSLTQ